MRSINRRTFIAPVPASAVSESSAESELLASFMLLSDTHIKPEDELSTARFTEALKQIAAFDRRPDALFVVGDLTSAGLQEQYDLFAQIVADSPFELSDMVFALGNHDQWVETETVEEYAAYRQRFVDSTGSPAVYYDRVIAGQHVIVIGPDEPLPDSCGSFVFTDEQLSWLEHLLEQDEADGIISYVFCHEPIDGTVTGTYEGEWGAGNSLAYGGEPLLEVFRRHPNCVFVTGHTHIFPGIEASDTSLPVFVNTGSCSRSYYSLKAVAENQLVSDGIQMEFYADKLVFNPRNFTNNEWENAGQTVSLPRS